MPVWLSIGILIETFCFLVALICLRNDRSKPWKYQVPFLLITVLTEVLGRYISKVLHHNNAWVYNIYIILEASFTTGIFAYLYNPVKKHTHVIAIGGTIFILTYLYDLHRHGFSEFNDTNDLVISIFYCFCSLYYYYILLKSDNYVKLSSDPFFWWVNGVLFYNFGSITCNIFFDYLITHEPHNLLRYYIFIILNVILNGCWSYAFLCRYKQTRLPN
jgi:hypothetical protein